MGTMKSGEFVVPKILHNHFFMQKVQILNNCWRQQNQEKFLVQH